ncbi:MAG TPA: class II fructose-bisphosphate aldolase [Clostridiaceae bacterium]|nr:class II fructose-bisphosphate aldolase [Clostridiaceae bacterium]
MSLEKVCDILKYADHNNFCVPAFNAFNYESIKWIIEAACEENSPAIVMLYPGMSCFIPFSTFAQITRDLASKASVPIGLHLDHSSSYEEILFAIKEGFTSVMADGSGLDFDKNIEFVRQVTKAAHAMGVDVEAELGRVGSASNADDFVNSQCYTRCEDVPVYIERTEVDCLAIAIGSAHGNYIATPKLDLERLSEINSITDIPLVLHGGTGIPEDQLVGAVRSGINKLNIGTEYMELFMSSLKSQAERGVKNYFACLNAIKPEVISYLKRKINLLKPRQEHVGA